MTGAEFALLATVITVGACLQGIIGFGMGLVAAPVMVLVKPELVPVALLILNAGLTVVIIRRERAALDLSGPKWAFFGRVPGTVLGAIVVAQLQGDVLTLLVAAAVLSGVLVSIGGWAPTPTRTALFMAGGASGFMGTTTSLGGPPMAMVWQSFRGPDLRAAMSSFFFIGCVMSLVALLVVGSLDTAILMDSTALMPFMLLGFVLSRRLSRLVDARGLRVAVLGVSTMGALTLVAQHFI